VDILQAEAAEEATLVIHEHLVVLVVAEQVQ
jgi:hypothetical protein